MSRRILRSILCLCLIAAPARAEIIEIPLTGLHGPYPVSAASTTRTVAFQLPRLPDLIHGASFRITGTASVGVADCGQIGEANLWPMEFMAEMEDTPGHDWQAVHEPSFLPGLFSWTSVFEPFPETATWDFLIDGAGEISLSGAPWTQLTVCSPVILPAGDVTEAVLIIDADFPLPAASSTWGKIKALYTAR